MRVRHLDQKTRSHPGAGFAWQEGYGAFSVSVSNRDSVRKYIAQQEAHHGKWSFQGQYRALLRKHGLEWDERYVADIALIQENTSELSTPV